MNTSSQPLLFYILKGKAVSVGQAFAEIGFRETSVSSASARQESVFVSATSENSLQLSSLSLNWDVVQLFVYKQQANCSAQMKVTPWPRWAVSIHSICLVTKKNGLIRILVLTAEWWMLRGAKHRECVFGRRGKAINALDIFVQELR